MFATIQKLTWRVALGLRSTSSSLAFVCYKLCLCATHKENLIGTPTRHESQEKYLMWHLHITKRKSLEINRSEKAGLHQHVCPNHLSRTMAKSDVAQWPIDVWLFTTPWTAAHQASLSFTISQSLLKLISTEWVMLSNHLILFHSLLLLSSIFPSIRIFSSEWALHIRWPNIGASTSASVLQWIFWVDFL